MSRSALSLVKKRKRKKLAVKLSIIFLVVFVLVGLGVFELFYFEDFKIKKVNISGVSEHQKGLLSVEVANLLSAKKFWIIPQNRVFSFSTKEAQVQIAKNFLNLKDIEVQKESNEILVQAKERSPLAILCEEENKECLFVDETGFVYGEAPFFSSGVFVKFFDNRSIKSTIGEYLVEENDLKNILFFKEMLEEFFVVEKIYLEKEGDCRFYLDDGSYVIVSNEDDWKTTINNFNIFYKDFYGNDFEYIDLRFGNKVYYK